MVSIPFHCRDMTAPGFGVLGPVILCQHAGLDLVRAKRLIDRVFQEIGPDRGLY